MFNILMPVKTSTNAYESIADENFPVAERVGVVKVIREAYKAAFDETIGNPFLASGPASEHFPQERRTKVQQGLIRFALENSGTVSFNESLTNPRGGRFVKLTIGKLIVVEKFWKHGSKLPTVQYIKYLTEQFNFFAGESSIKTDQVFCILAHGYSRNSHSLDCLDFVDLVFPDPVNPEKLSSALCRINLMATTVGYIPINPIQDLPKPVVTLKIQPDKISLGDKEITEFPSEQDKTKN